MNHGITNLQLAILLRRILHHHTRCFTLYVRTLMRKGWKGCSWLRLENSFNGRKIWMKI